MPSEKIEVSFTPSTIVLAIFLPIALFAGAMVFFHPQDKACDVCPVPDDRILPPRYPGSIGDIGEYKLQQPAAGDVPPPVNTFARDEVKQAGGSQLKQQVGGQTVQQTYAAAKAEADKHGALMHCRQIGGDYQCFANLPDGRKWVATNHSSTRAYSGLNRYVALLEDMRRGVVANNAVQPLSLPNLTPPVTPVRVPGISNSVANGRKQLAIFVDGSARANLLDQWFASDRRLVDLKSKCAFERYEPNNLLYRSRYADVVPVSQFPAVLLLQPDGGHIYAAGGNMLPRTPAELYDDMAKAYELSKSVEAAVPAEYATSGLLKQTGYSWDDAISPDMQLVEQDCPDGNCPVPSGDTWRPGDRVRDLFEKRSERNALFFQWMNAEEIATVVLLLVTVGLAFAVINKFRG